jgi:hypothetical protein
MKSFRPAAAILLLATLLTGCSATSDATVPSNSVSTDSGSALAKDMVANPNSAADESRSIIKTGYVSLEISDISTAKLQLNKIANKNEGLIESWSQESNNSGELYAIHAAIRVPASEIDKSLEQISTLGNILSLNVSNVDVTAQVIDLDARVASLKASVLKLQKLMDSAKTTSDLLAAETALSQRQADLESLVSQQKYLKNQVSLATINVDVYAQGRGPIATPTSFFDGIQEGWKALMMFFTGAIVFFGMATPWLIVLAPLALAAFLLWRRLRRR